MAAPEGDDDTLSDIKMLLNDSFDDKGLWQFEVDGATPYCPGNSASVTIYNQSLHLYAYCNCASASAKATYVISKNQIYNNLI